MTNIRANAFAAHQRGDLVTAERLYRALLRSSPSDAELLHYMGVLCAQTDRNSDSLQWLRKALALAPASLPTLQLLIRICTETGETAGALDALDRYLAQRPDDAGVLDMKGQQLVRLGRYREAEPVLREAANISQSGPMFHDLGFCRLLLGDHLGAATAFREAVGRGHNHPKTGLWLAQCLRATGSTGEYYRVATAASDASPDDLELLIEAQSARRYVCDWNGFYTNQPTLLTRLKHVLESDGEHVIPPGVLNYLEIDEGTIASAARRYAGQLAGFDKHPEQWHRKSPRDSGGKLRLGYLSTDLFAHAVGFLVRDLFSCHDRTRFEIYGYSLRHQPDAVQSAIQEGCDHYRNVSGYSTDEVVRAIRDDQIDILIDLAGYTSAARPAVLAARPAPVQVSWLGYLGTSGSNFIDYIIADEMVIPPEIASDYTEKIIRLPCFIVASELPVADKRPSREDLGFGTTDVIFCSFNQPYKLDGQTFETWMEILRRVPASKLWLYAPDTEICRANLHHEAARRDVNPDRLVFAPSVPMPEHVARMSLADLALDPFHISGGATSVAGLAAGVPILSLRGGSFLARMGSSINTHLGLDELDCATPDEYIARAVELAASPASLAALKERLGVAVNKGGFFNTAVFTRSLEEALLRVWERYTAGLPANDVTISEAPDPRIASQLDTDNAVGSKQ